MKLARLETHRYDLRQAVVQATAAVAPVDLARVAADPEQVWRRHADRPVKLSHSSLLVEATISLDGVPTRVAYKRLRAKSWWKRLLAWARPSRARRSWQLGRLLVEQGIPTAEPLLLCEPRAAGLSGTSYLATRWIDGSRNLHLYAWHLRRQPPELRLRRTRQAAVSLGRLLGRMHRHRLANRDLKGLNLVLVEQPHDVQAYLIDPDGLKRCWFLSSSQRACNLARLAASVLAHPWIGRSDRLRFVRAYLGELGQPPQAWKRLWRQTARQVQRIQLRMRRQGKPLA